MSLDLRDLQNWIFVELEYRHKGPLRMQGESMCCHGCWEKIGSVLNRRSVDRDLWSFVLVGRNNKFLHEDISWSIERGLKKEQIQILLQDITTREREVKQTTEACESKVLRILKNRWHLGLERWLRSSEHLLLLQRPQAWFPEPTWQLITFSNSSSRRSDTYFRPPRTPGPHLVHIHTSDKTPTHIK